jgi:phage-related protein
MSRIWDTENVKKVIFHPKALGEFRDLPIAVRKAFGEMLRVLQEGINLGMPDSRPMPVVAIGVDELRAKDPSGQYRAFYLKKSKEGILVLRAFHKKSQETPQSEIKLARRRLQELLHEISRETR